MQILAELLMFYQCIVIKKGHFGKVTLYINIVSFLNMMTLLKTSLSL